MSEFITIGEPMAVLASQDLDTPLSEVVHFEKFLAGAELNVAVGLSRLEHDVAYISKVGRDSFGDFILASSKKAGIDTRYLSQTEDFLTGFYLKEKVSDGDPKTDYFRKNSAAANLSAEELANLDLTGVKLAHLSGIFAALSETSLAAFKAINQKLNATNIQTVFDPNLRPALWQDEATMVETTNELAKANRIILPGINEGEILMGSREPEQIADFYLSQSELTQAVVVKLGADGAYVKTKSGESYTVEGYKVDEVVDTVGAGDGFAVGLESALLEGWSLRDAVQRACAVGALAVQSPGDNDGYPTREELVNFINNHSNRGEFAC